MKLIMRIHTTFLYMCDVLKCAYPEINGCKYKSIAALPSEMAGDSLETKLTTNYQYTKQLTKTMKFLSSKQLVSV